MRIHVVLGKEDDQEKPEGNTREGKNNTILLIMCNTNDAAFTKPGKQLLIQ
jgi:hypothetical protein